MADPTREQFGTELFSRAITGDGVFGDVLLEEPDEAALVPEPAAESIAAPSPARRGEVMEGRAFEDPDEEEQLP